MKRWLIKTEPAEYSFDRLIRESTTRWEGVSNALALRYLRQMKWGDTVLVYHSGAEKAVVGLAEIVSDPYPDPASDDPRKVVVDISAREALAGRIPLRAIKADKRFQSFDLVRISRLSVMPVSGAHWKILMKLSKQHTQGA